MRILLIATLCSLTCLGAQAQTQPLGTVIGRQTVIPISVNPPGYPVDAQALIYYPDDYFLPQNANKRYPLFLFLHGAGEGATTNIAEVTNQSLPYLIRNGLNPYGIDTLTGDTVKFIVVSPHCASCGGSYWYPQLQYTIPYLIKNYRIDTTCMWAGGLSSGGRATFSMPMGMAVGDTYWGQKLAGIMPIANGGYDNNIGTLGVNLATSVKSGLTVLYTIGDQDPGYNPAGYFAYNSLMSANALAGKYYNRVIIGGTHSSNVWNPPFYMTSRIWNANHNAWDQMASTHRKAGTTTTPLTVNAGTAQTITLPLTSITLGGSATPGTGASLSSHSWSFVSGPATPVIASVAGLTTVVTGLLSAGTYTFKFTATDSKGGSASGTVQIVVNPLINKPPTANAGPDQTITQPASTVTLSGSGADADGTVVSYAWTRITGASGAIVTSGTSPSTTITGLTAGTYTFSLTVTDNLGAKAADTVQITVNAAVPSTPTPNKPPVANAGPDQTITLPTNSVTLAGSGTDPDGTVVSYLWTRISGGAAMVVSGLAPTTQITGLVQGTYVFSLTVTDNTGAKSADTVKITVNATPSSGSSSTGGVTVGNQYVISVPVNPPGYALSQALIYYPDDYFLPANASKKYALYIFLHDETQGMTTDVSELNNVSLPQLISQGLKPYGIDSVTKDTVKFIIVSPHAALSGGSYSYPQLRYTIPYLLSNFRVDTNCVWLGGPSMGGRGTFSVPMEDVSMGGKLAGIMPMSSGGYDNRMDLLPNLSTCLKNGMGYIYTVGAADQAVVGYAEYYNSVMSKGVLPGRGFYKEIAGLGHTTDAWTQPFLLTSRWWTANRNAWDVMASTHKSAKTATVVAQAAAQQLSAQFQTADAATTSAAAVTLYPNPVRDAFTLTLNNAFTGKMMVQVIDGSGVTRKMINEDKSQAVSQVTVTMSDLASGVYFVRIQVGTWTVTKKIVKL